MDHEPLHIPYEDLLQEAEITLRKKPTVVESMVQPIIDDASATPLDKTRALLLIARAMLFCGNLERGDVFARGALDLAQLHSLSRFVGLAHNECGIFRFVQSDFQTALKHYAQALELLEVHGTKVDMSKVYINMGNVYHRTDDEVRAIDVYEKAASLSAETGDLLTEAKVLSNMAGMYGHILYDTEAAIRCSKRAIELYTILKDQIGLAKAYVNLANQYRATRRVAEALDLYKKALALRTEHCEPEDFLTNNQGLILTLIDQGELEEARLMLEWTRSHDLVRDYHNGSIYLDQIEVYLLSAEGKHTEALIALERVEKFVDVHSYDEALDFVLRTKVDCLRTLGRDSEALQVMSELFELRTNAIRRRAEFRLVKLQSQLDLQRAQSQAEVERLRNVELARALEDARRLQEENRQYIAFMAHELKSPLNTIQSVARLLSTDFNMPIAERMSLNADVFEVATRMFELVTQVLETGKQGNIAERPGIVDIGTIWEHVTGLWRHRTAEKNITLRVTPFDVPIFVRAKETSAISILDNLLSNAVKFSPPTTSVTVSVSITESKNSSGTVCISVRDEGPGLTAEDLDRLFTPYGTLSARPTQGEDSTGLGLLIVKREVENLGGRIWCESIMGQGASFFVELPLCGAEEIRTLQQQQ